MAEHIVKNFSGIIIISFRTGLLVTAMIFKKPQWYIIQEPGSNPTAFVVPITLYLQTWTSTFSEVRPGMSLTRVEFLSRMILALNLVPVIREGGSKDFQCNGGTHYSLHPFRHRDVFNFISHFLIAICVTFREIQYFFDTPHRFISLSRLSRLTFQYHYAKLHIAIILLITFVFIKHFHLNFQIAFQLITFFINRHLKPY